MFTWIHSKCLVVRTMWTFLFFFKLTLLFQEALPLTHSVIKFYFYIIFCPGWLSNWIMNNIPAAILMDIAQWHYHCQGELYKKASESFLLTRWDLSRVSSFQLVTLLCLPVHLHSSEWKPLAQWALMCIIFKTIFTSFYANFKSKTLLITMNHKTFCPRRKKPTSNYFRWFRSIILCVFNPTLRLHVPSKPRDTPVCKPVVNLWMKGNREAFFFLLIFFFWR